MSAVLYCSKLNLVSGHIFEVYKDESMLHKILDILLSDISSSTVYEVDNEFIAEDGTVVRNTVTYKISILEKQYDHVHGYLCKDSQIYYKTFDENSKELIRHSIPYTEAVQFYFDVHKEAIVFHTASRLGYQEFNNAMTGLFNKMMENANREFRFEVVLRTEGLSLVEIEDELKRIDNIYELTFRFQPPNAGSETLKRIKENGEKFIDTMENANVTRVSTVFSTKGGRGLNLDSELIRENIDKIKGINSVTGERDSISKGYIAVDAVDAHGKKYTTADSKPLKTVISSLDHFVRECRRVISSLN